MSSSRSLDRATLVRAVELGAIGVLVAAALLDQRDMGAIGTRYRVLLVAQVSSPALGLLCVLAAATAVITDRGRRPVQAAGVLLAVLAIAGAWASASLGEAPGGPGWRVGIAAYAVANGVLAGFAVWLAAERSVSGAGSRPDGGSA